MSKSKSRVKKSAPLAAQADPFAGDVSSQAALEAVSIPPVTDDISNEHFFSRDSSPPMADDDDDDDETVKERALRQTPEVRARIARAQRIVMGLVGAAAIVTFAGLGSKALRQTASAQAVAASPRSALVAEAPKPLEAKLELPKAPAPMNLEAPKPAEPAKVEEPVKVAEKPAKVEVAPSAAPSAADPATPTKTALEEKKDSQRALDRGKSKDAIASGERSVALDPADGEAWLILGAAYQEQGKMTDARRCYQACLKEGKRGPKGECAAMLH